MSQSVCAVGLDGSHDVRRLDTINYEINCDNRVEMEGPLLFPRPSNGQMLRESTLLISGMFFGVVIYRWLETRKEGELGDAGVHSVQRCTTAVRGGLITNRRQ